MRQLKALAVNLPADDNYRRPPEKVRQLYWLLTKWKKLRRLCDRIILLKDGNAAAYGTVKDVRKAHGGKSLDDIFISV